MNIGKYFIIPFLILCIVFSNPPSFATEKAETVTIQLKWFYQFQFAGYYAAKEKGYYAEEGLDVVLKERNPIKGYVQAVLDGDAEYGVGDAGLLFDRMLGKPVVLLKQIFQHSPLVYLSMKDSGIISPYDMVGKKVMFDKKDHRAPLMGMLLDTLGSLDKITAVPHSFKMKDLVSGNVDVISASITNEIFSFKQQGIPVNIINPQDYSIDFYGDNLFTIEEEVKKHHERVEKMIRATLKGWQYALEHPDELIDIILKKYNSQLSRERLIFEAKMTDLMILSEITPLGSVSPIRYERIARTFVKGGGVKAGVDLRKFIYKCPKYKVEQAALTTPELPLTSDEKAWLAAHPKISVGIMNAWPPMNFVDERSRPCGIGVDYIKLINKRLNGVLTIVPEPFKDSYDRVKNKKLGALMDITPKKTREPFFNFTKPYLTIPHVIVGRRDGPYFSSEKDLAGKTIALERGFYNIKYFRENHPEVTIKEYDSTSDTLDAVARSEADAYAGNRAVAMYLMEKELLANLQVQGRLHKPPVILTIGVRKDWPQLASILDRAFSSITEEEVRQIRRRWAGLEDRCEETTRVTLTPEQQTWLDAHPQIHVGIMEAWPPMDFLDDLGNPQGIGVDFIEALNKRLGGRFTIVPGPWKKTYDQVKNKQLEALMDITPRKNREPYFNFTRPYANIPHVIVAPRDGPYYRSAKDLSGKTIALERGFFIVRHLRENYPDIRIQEYDSTSDALDAVSKRAADAYAGNRAVAIYLIEKELLSNLQVQGKLRETVSVNSIGVRKDWPELVAILDRTLASLSQNEVRSIYQKWGGIGHDEKIGPFWINLTPEEKAWLSDHPIIRVAPDANWVPVEFIDDNGEFKGVSADYLKKMSSMLGVELQFIKDVSFKETVDKLRNRELDIFSAAIESPERKAFATFTKPYLSLPTAVFTLDYFPYINSLAELAGRKVAVVQGYAVTEFIKREYPQIKIVEVRNIPEALRKLQSKQVFAYVGTILITGHYIRKEGYTNLKISGQTDFKLKIAMAARSDWPILAGLLQKALDAIDEGERNAIFKKWVAVTFEKHVDYSLIYKVVLGALLLLSVFLLWNQSLAREVAERKRAEEVIKESEERLKLALKGGNLGFWDVNLQTGETIFNERWAEMLEYSPDELEQTRETWMNSIHPDDRERILKVGQDYRKGRIPDYEVEYRAVTKQANIIWQVSKGAIVARDEQGFPIRMVGTAMDISERKRAEEEIKNSEQRLAQIINFLPDATFVIDCQSKVIAWNKAIEELTGISAGDILDKGNYEYSLPFHGERRPLLIDLVSRRDEEMEKKYLKFRKEGDVLFAESYNPDLRTGGVYLSSSARLLYNAREQVMGAIQSIRDVTERKRIDESLRESEESYRLLVKNLPSIVYKGFRDWSVKLYDNKIELMTGYTMHEFNSGMVKWAELVVAEDVESAKHKFIEALKSDKSYVRDYRVKNRSDNILWIQERGQIVCDDSGEIEYVIGVIFDITERKQMEAELFRAKESAEEADRLKSAFLAAMSHELRTPLNSIIGFTGIMLQELAGPLNEEQHKQLKMVQSSSRHLLALINDVLDISKIEAGQLELFPTSFELRQSIDKMVKLVSPLADKKGIDLRLDIADDIKTVITDQRRLEQIILNLLNNAVKFTEKGHVGISCRIENDQYLLAVSDTGIGMRPEEHPNLFKPFHQIDSGLTRKHEGSGLGLSICKKLLDIMDGTIDMESQWGQGSTFMVRLPRQTGGVLL